MTAQAAGRPAFRRRVMLLLAPILALGALYVLSNRDTGEKVPDPPFGTFPSRTHNGTQYSLQQTRETLRLWAQRGKDQSPKLLASVDVGARVAYGGANNNFFGDDAYWEVAEPQMPFQAGPPGPGTRRNSAVPFLGRFLVPAEPRKPEEGERGTPFHLTPTDPIRQIDVIHASLSHGGFEWMKLAVPGKTLDRLSRAITSKGVYWLPQLPIDGRQVESRKGSRIELPPKYDLMFSPFGGGASRRVLSGVYGPELWAGRDCIFWITPRAYPDERQDLHCLRTSDDRHTVIPDYTSPNSPTECAGRLYWGELAAESDIPSRPVRIVSANMDGTDRRLDFVPGKGGKYLYGYGAHNDKMYVVVSDAKEAIPGKGRASFWLGQLDPAGRSDPHMVQQLPNSYSGEPEFDEEYLYYYRPKPRAGLFDSFGPTRRFRVSLQRYRVRLPD